MNGIRLTWKRAPIGLIDASPLRPDRLCDLKVADLRQVRVQCGRRAIAIEELFQIESVADEPEPVLHIPGSRNFLHLGAEMQSGILHVDGHAGDLVGAAMRGGRIIVSGDAGVRVGAGLRGGRIMIKGNVGNLLGGPRPGGEHGITGGVILVLGNAGDYVALRQRRGLIAVAGLVGESAGLRMSGGTLVVCNSHPATLGCGTAGGTIITLNGELPPLPTFRPNSVGRPVILRLLWRRLADLGFPLPPRLDERSFHQYSGDVRFGGRGELFVPNANP